MTVNTWVNLNFAFSLADTVSKNDYLTIDFPTGTQINYLTKISPQLNIASGTYSSANNRLTFTLSDTSPNVNSGTSISLTFLYYRVPPSTKTTEPIVLSIMNNGYAKMSGSATITPQPNSYVGTVSTLDTTINANTQYSLRFTMSDSISTTGYIKLTLPQELSLSSTNSDIVVSIAGTSIAAAPAVSVDSSHQLTLSSLNLTSTATIPAQTLNISISGIIQPPSVQILSNFEASIYYSSADNDLVANVNGQTSTTVTITPG